MPENTDSPAQRRRKKDALKSALVSSGWMGLSGVALLVLSTVFVETSLVRTMLTIVSLLELGMIVPVWISVPAEMRLKEARDPQNSSGTREAVGNLI